MRRFQFAARGILACFSLVSALVFLSLHPVLAAGTRSVAARTMYLPQIDLRAVGNTLGLEPAGRPGNFPFRTVQSADGLVIVHFYNRDQSFGNEVLAEAANDLLHPIKDTLGFSLKSKVDIYIYNTRADFLVGADVKDPQETGAYTDLFQHAIYMPIESPGDEADYLPHELTHIVFHENLDVGHIQSAFFGFFPLWLDEGLATHDQPADSQQLAYFDSVLQGAASGGYLADMFTDFNFAYPNDANTDLLCYAEAHSFIGYLINTYGLTTFHQFLSQIGDGALLVAAENVFKADLQTLRGQWETSLGAVPDQHDSGNTIKAPTPVALAHGSLPSVYAQTEPFATTGSDQFVGDSIRTGLILAILAWGCVGVGYLLALRRKQQLDAVRAAEMFLAQPRSGYYFGGYGANQYPPTYPPPYASPYGMEQPFTPPPPPPPVALLQRQPAPATAFATVDMVVVLVAIPAMLLAGLLWAAVGASHEWHASYVAAEVVGGIILVALVAVLVRAIIRRNVTVAHVAGIVLTLIALLVTHAQSISASIAQAHAYESQQAYALAIKTLTDAGAPGADIAEVQNRWAQAAFDADDYATASDHWRAALTADPTSHTYATLLTQTTIRWGHALIGANQYDLAGQVYDAQYAFSACDATCKATFGEAAGEAHLDQAVIQALGGNSAASKTTLIYVQKHYPQTQAAAAAQRALSVKTVTLASAFQAGAAGDTQAEQVLLALDVAQHPQTTDAAIASEVPMPVTGALKDRSGDAVAGDRLFFFGFTTKSDAQHFFDANVPGDSSVVKFATTVGKDSTFSVQLAPGYWYLPVWDDPSQGRNHYFNVPTSTSQVFTVAPLLPADFGTITGV